MSSSRAVARGGAGCGRGLGWDGWFGASGLGARGCGLGGGDGRAGLSDADGFGAANAREGAGLLERGIVRLGRGWCGGILGNFVDHFVAVGAEMDSRGISGGDVKSAQDELGALEVDGVADEGVDDFHEGGLDAFFVLDEGDGVKAGFGRGADTADHALMEVAEDFAAESGGAAGGSVDLDVSADADVLVERHGAGTFRIWIEKFLRSSW